MKEPQKVRSICLTFWGLFVDSGVGSQERSIVFYMGIGYNNKNEWTDNPMEKCWSGSYWALFL